MSRLRTGLLVAALVVVPVVALVASASTPTRPGGKLVPSQGVLLGAYTNLTGTWAGDAVAAAQVRQREAQIGRSYDVDNHFYGWKDAFPSALDTGDVAAGRTPLITWTGTTLTSVTNGSQDALIAARADGVRRLGADVFIRWNWEMNGDWNPNGGPASNTPGQTDGPAKYVAAWRHIHDIFVAHGATNAVWVWAPNATSVPNVAWNSFASYYPGDGYVDWVGASSYNWGTVKSWSHWHSMTSTLAPLYAQYSTRKPMMIAETASTETGGSKAAWIADAEATLPTMPAIAAVLWFDQNKETSWAIDSSSASLAAFRTMAQDPYFNTRARPAPPATPTPTPPPTPTATPTPTPKPPVSSTPVPSVSAVATAVPAATVVYTAIKANLSTTARPLGGATVSGDIWVRVKPVAAASSVAFYLDDPALARAPRQVERWAPYDLGGTAASGANPFATSALTHGTHSLTLVITGTTGKRVVQTTYFLH